MLWPSLMDKARQLQGIVFRQRRERRRLSRRAVAERLGVPERNVTAYELGVLLQTPVDAEAKLNRLNSEWTGEELSAPKESSCRAFPPLPKPN